MQPPLSSLSLRDAELLPYFFLAELPRVALEHSDSLLNRHVNLVADRHKAFRQMLIVAHHEPDSDHEVVDVVEDERVLAAVDLLTLEKMHWVISPVS